MWQQMKRAVVVLSGGIESLVTAAVFRDQNAAALGHAIFVRYGQKALPGEERAVRDIARRYALNLEVVDMVVPFLTGHDMLDEDSITYGNGVLDPEGSRVKPDNRSHVIPYRNLVFVAIGAMFASTIKATELWVGFDYTGDSNPTATSDKSPEFVKALSRVLDIAKEGKAVKVVTPLQGNVKEKTIRLGERLGVDWSSSWSCYNYLGKPCGVCAQCNTRQRALKACGVDEGVQYCTLEELKELVRG